MAANEQEPKIVSDSDWKEQARQEKERLAQKQQKEKSTPTGAAEPTGSGAAGGRPMPPATFMTMVNSLVVQSLFFLGKLPEAEDKEPQVNLDLAKHNIDMLGMLEEKTKGNLTDEENKALALALHEVRMQYVATAQV